MGYEKYDFDIPIAEEGDCYARYLIRMEEMRQSIRICRQVLDTMPDGPVNVADSKGMLPNKERVLMSMEELIHHFIIATQGINAPEGEVYFAAENPKGELGFYIHSKGGGVPNRLKIRSPSYCNLSIVSKLLPGHMVSDIPAILGSLGFRDGRVRQINFKIPNDERNIDYYSIRWRLHCLCTQRSQEWSNKEGKVR